MSYERLHGSKASAPEPCCCVSLGKVHPPSAEYSSGPYTLKTELVHHRDYQTRDEARRDIFDFVEIFYNRQRRHSTLGYLNPAQFEVTALAA
jgi:transposase InsO family protein